MRRGSEFAPVILVFVKDGVILMIALMMIYGTLIPIGRRPRRGRSRRCSWG
jgi:hypothetical protein